VNRELRFAFGDVVLLREQPADTVDSLRYPAHATWPCPGCGERRPLGGAWMLRVCDRGGTIRPWNVLVCAGCAAHAGVSGPSDGSRPDHGTAQPRDTPTRGR
jgi:hypothetical protein